MQSVRGREIHKGTVAISGAPGRPEVGIFEDPNVLIEEILN